MVFNAMNSQTLLIGVLLLASTVFPVDRSVASEPGQDGEIRLGATLVEVPTIVTDREGRFITDLSRENFRVFENGRRQAIDHFVSIEQPFNVVLVLDTSNSAQDRLSAIQVVAKGFIREVRPDDRMMVISFDHDVHRLTDLTSSHQELNEAVDELETGFGKLLFEAVTAGINELRDLQGRRAVILLSDGIDMKSIDADAESSLRLAEETGVSIYAIRFDTRWWVEAEARRRQAERPASNLPITIDGRIPLPPDFGGPDPTPTGIPKPRAPRIEIGTGGQPPVVMGDRTRPGEIPERHKPDDLSRNLDRLYGEADTYFKSLASRTGGRVFEAINFAGITSAFSTIAEELRNQYVLGYYPGERDDRRGFRRIRVEVDRKDHVVRSRPGYRLPDAR